MAPLTWRNVDAPTFSGVTDSQRLMGQMLNNGFSSLDQALGNFQEGRTQSESAQLMMDVLRHTDPAAMDAALQSGTAFAGVNPRNISPEALRFLAGRTNDLLRNDGQRISNEGGLISNEGGRLANQGRRIANSHASWNSQRARSQEAGREAALQRVLDMRTLAQEGTPEANALVQQMARESAPVFSAAGLSVSDALNLVDRNLQAAGDGLGLNESFVQASDRARNREHGLAAEDLAGQAVDRSSSTGEAAAWLRGLVDVDPRIRDAAIGVLEQQGDRLIGPPTDANELLLQLGGGSEADTLMNDITQGDSLLTQGQSVLDTLTADSGFNPMDSMVNELASRPNRNRHTADIVRELHETIGDDSGLREQDITTALNKIRNEHGVSADIAAAVLKNSVETTPWGQRWYYGDRYIDNNRVSELIGNFINTETGEVEADKLADAVARMEEQRFKQEAQPRIEARHQQLALAQQAYLDAQNRARTHSNIDLETPRRRLEAARKALEDEIKAIDNSPFSRANTGSLGSR